MKNATPTNTQDGFMDTELDADELDYIPDEDLINDLIPAEGYDALVEYTVSDVYKQTVITNRLLGIIVALVIIMMIFGLMKFIMGLVRDNITNYF